MFTETCVQANKEIARELGKKIDAFPDSYYKNIAMFRALFNKYKKEQNLLFFDVVDVPYILKTTELVNTHQGLPTFIGRSDGR